MNKLCFALIFPFFLLAPNYVSALVELSDLEILKYQTIINRYICKNKNTFPCDYRDKHEISFFRPRISRAMHLIEVIGSKKYTKDQLVKILFAHYESMKEPYGKLSHYIELCLIDLLEISTSCIFAERCCHNFNPFSALQDDPLYNVISDKLIINSSLQAVGYDNRHQSDEIFDQKNALVELNQLESSLWAKLFWPESIIISNIRY